MTLKTTKKSQLSGKLFWSNCRMSMSGFGLLEAIELTVITQEKCLVSELGSDYGKGIILSG